MQARRGLHGAGAAAGYCACLGGSLNLTCPHVKVTTERKGRSDEDNACASENMRAAWFGINANWMGNIWRGGDDGQVERISCGEARDDYGGVEEERVYSP
jgi:hypothetical protein